MGTMRVQKATHEQLRTHNRQLLLRAIYQGVADNRAALAQATGLTKPTVSNLVAELIADGYVDEGGRGPSSESGGKRPRLVAFRPNARHVIGLGVDHEGVHGVLADLAGTVTARHRSALEANDPVASLTGVIDGLCAQLDAPLLCIGVGVPGEIDGAAGMVRRSDALGWRDLPLTHPLTERYAVPVHLGHGTELCALAQYAFGGRRDDSPLRLVTLQIGRGIELGVALEGGTVHYGGDLGSLHGHLPGTAGPARLEDLLNVGEDEATEPPDYLGLRYAASLGDAAARERVQRLAARVAPVVAWTAALLRPNQLALAGPIVDLGDEFLADVARHAGTWHPGGHLDDVQLTLAYANRLGALGAVALAVQRELAIL